jgi:hypothetical protein
MSAAESAVRDQRQRINLHLRRMYPQIPPKVIFIEMRFLQHRLGVPACLTFSDAMLVRFMVQRIGRRRKYGVGLFPFPHGIAVKHGEWRVA